MGATVRIVPQEEIARGTTDPPRVRLPDGGLFADRAQRFRTLSAGHPDADYLAFMASLADAQHAALAAYPAPLLPDELHRERCRAHALPPLASNGARDPAWREALGRILDAVEPHAPDRAREAIRALHAATPERLDAAAGDLIDLDYPSLDAREATFLAAALQVSWVKRSAALGVEAFGALAVPNLCPVCGALPVASVLRIDVPAPGTRYLHCSLCAAEWLLPRGQCTQCDAREKVAYFHVEGGSLAAKAEACDECRGYIKVFNAEKDARVDPVADDLASLALDVLMDATGYQRASPNLFFLPGPS